MRLFASIACLAVLELPALSQCVSNEVFELRDTIGSPNNDYGREVALDGDFVVVGAERDDFQGTNSGSVRIFQRAGPGWDPVQTLLPSALVENDRFGTSVDIDASWIVAGAPMGFPLLPGNAFVYEFDGSSWIERQDLRSLQPLMNPGGDFGRSVSIRGNVVAVGAPNTLATGIPIGALYVFRRAGTTWSFEERLSNPNRQIGSAIVIDGDVLVTTDRMTTPGSVVIYRFNGASWVEEETLNGFTAVGFADFDLDLDGDRLAIGIPGFESSAGATGAALIYRYDGSSWDLEQEVVGSDTLLAESFGSSVSLRGDRLVVGSPGAPGSTQGTGAAYLYRRDARSSTWIEERKLASFAGRATDLTGFAVATDGIHAACGAPGRNCTFVQTAENCGTVFAFELDAPLAFCAPAFCFGDGGDTSGCTPCPCGNDSMPGLPAGCTNSEGRSARLHVLGPASASSNTLRIEAEGATASSFAALVSGDVRLPSNPANPCFGTDSGLVTPMTPLDGLRCISGATVVRHGARATDSVGAVGVTNNAWGVDDGPSGGLVAASGFVVGQTRHWQLFYRETPALGCGTGQNTSNGVTTTIAP